MLSPEILRRFSIFAGLPAQAFTELAQFGSEATFETDTLLFEEGDAADEIYVLLEGSVDLLMNLDDKGEKQIEIETLVAGELVGWSALVEPYIYKASAAATSRVRVAILDGAKLRDYVAAHPEQGLVIMRQLAQIMGKRLNQMRVRLISLAV